jgi:hypothetical protein
MTTSQRAPRQATDRRGRYTITMVGRPSDDDTLHLTVH